MDTEKVDLDLLHSHCRFYFPLAQALSLRFLLLFADVQKILSEFSFHSFVLLFACGSKIGHDAIVGKNLFNGSERKFDDIQNANWENSKVWLLQ